MTGSRAVEHVYVHAPFCRRRCVYCDFAVEVSSRPDGHGWLRAIAAEKEALAGQGIRLRDPLRTLYLGGGTPSLLPVEVIPELARVVFPAGVGPGGEAAHEGLEWTAEANPESFDASVAAAWAAAGVNRVSLGAQTFSPESLRWMGRLHAPDDVNLAVRRARDAGIDNLSVDLILGLPDSVDRDWSGDLDRLLGLDVPHVSVYGLTVEPGTPLSRQVSEGRTSAPSEERYQAEFLDAHDRLVGAGYVHYEVSNFARPGFESRHNRAYWDRSPYVGLGNGAHSWVAGRRWWNHRSWSRYRDAVARGDPAVAGDEHPTEAQAELERLWLALRTSDGLPLPAPGSSAEELVEHWQARGLAGADGERLTLTAPGWLLLDELVVELDRALSSDAISTGER